MIFEPFKPFISCAFHIKFATWAWERDAAAKLRRDVFCREQKIFERDDYDQIDDVAIPIVALSMLGVGADSVVGTVRIHEPEPGVWWGSRLAVAADHRSVNTLGSSLIKLAVSSAHARGCKLFLAHVQAQNVPLFRRMHWKSVGETDIHGRLHHRMEADLNFYPPFAAPEVGFMALSKKVA